jgi:hypothetical protein
MASADLNLNNIGFQNRLRSKPIRENFTDIENNYNALRAEVNAGIASTASEVTSGRDNYDTLVGNINARRAIGSGLYSGGLVSATSHNYVYISTGAGITPNGVGVSFDGAISNTIPVVTKPRYIVAVANSDNSLSLELGATGDDPTLPAITNTQRALGIIYQGTADPITFSNSNISDARRQGAFYNNNYYFAIQDAVSVANSTIGGNIQIGDGRYYEEIDLSGKNNVTLKFDNDSILYRPDDTTYAIKSINTPGSETSGIKVINADLRGNSKTGNKELLNFQFTDEFIIDGCRLDGNVTSTATYTNAYINNCDNFHYRNTISFDGSGNIDLSRVSINAPSSSNSLLLNEYGKKWVQIGNSLSISGIAGPSITALSSTRIAYIDDTNADLRTYDFDGTSWTQTGNDLNISGVGAASITALSSTRIAFIDAGNDDLRTYDFDGTDWSQTGNDLNITNVAVPSITALSSTRIAFIDGTNDDLRTYDFDGTDWSQVGNDLNISDVAASSITALSSTRIAFIDAGNADIRTYDFDGTDWSQTGNDLNITVAVLPSITALSSTRIALIESTNESLKIYEFDGADWFLDGNGTSISGIADPSITALGGSRIAFIDNTVENLQTYDLKAFIKGSETPPAPVF